MSKAFTREENEGPGIPDLPPLVSTLAPGAKNYITAAGAQKLRDELRQLVEITRPGLANSSDDPDAKRQWPGSTSESCNWKRASSRQRS